jgi:hypothetical protein
MIEILLQAERALGVGLLDRAETLYSQVAKADPLNSIAVVGLARVTLDRGDDEGALELARTALAIDPENVAAQRMVARLVEVLEYRADHDTDATPAADVQPSAATEPAPEAEAEPKAEPEPEPEPEVVFEAEPDPAPEAEPEVEVAFEPEPEPVTEREPTPDVEVLLEADPAPESQPEIILEAEPERAPEPEMEPEPEPTPEPEPPTASGRPRSLLDRILRRR